MHNRRARPTLRVLKEDLRDGWESPQPRRILIEGDLSSLSPLSELPHPIIAKAAEAFGPDPSRDNPVGPIQSVTAMELHEIKTGQWRGGVWTDPATGVCWLVTAGIAKGDHEDHDDFYLRAKRVNDAGTASQWLPTPEDGRLLNRETAALVMLEWELAIQHIVLQALRQVASGGDVTVALPHPVDSTKTIGNVTIEVEPHRGEGIDSDDIVVEFAFANDWIATQAAWTARVRCLISLHPPAQGWDPYKETYSNIAEPGAWTSRVDVLADLVQRGELDAAVPGAVSHYSHREHVMLKTVEGRALRAMCGVFFVPMQDHEALPICPICEEHFNSLPTV